MKYIYLLLAIFFEVFSTSLLKITEGFTKVIPTSLVFIFSAISFFFLSLTLQYFKVSVVYAVWSGLGIFLITIIAAIYYKEVPNLMVMLGMFFIIFGVILIYIFR